MSIKLKGSSDGSVSFDAPADTSPSGSDITLTLPTSAGSANQFLKNSGIAGELEYSSMVEDSTGLGIGTTAPDALCHINKTSGTTLYRASVGSNSTIGLEIVKTGSTTQSWRIVDGQTVNGKLEFYDVTDSATRMCIDGSGNIGIASTSPDAELHIGGSEPHIDIGPDNSNRGKIGYKSSDMFFGVSASAGDFIFKSDVTSTSNPADDGNERMRLTGGGCLVLNGTSVVSRSQTVNFQVGEGSNSFGIQRANSVNVVECVTEVGTTTTRTAHLFKNPNGSVGSINIQSNSVAYNTTSDYRLKENIVDLDGAITRVKQLLPRRFNFISDDTTTVDGFVAHEAATVVPEAVTGAHNGVKVWEDGEELPNGVSVGDNKLDEEGNTIPVYQGIDQSKLVPLLTAALQEAIAKIETLETKVAALEAA